ncbi:MAG: hypothetical protein PQJ58_02695 [Spirochaetales bacterium]|nr:hypothetical protein [Spirochaetales bacterium]
MKTIYYLKWKDQSALFSDLDHQSLISALDEEDLRICYGSSLTEEDKNSINIEMKTAVETAVNRWINDSRFLIHLLMAAGVFLVSYYFLSYVIRDPLPVIDEIILSILLGALAWYRLKNQEHQSERAINRKLELGQFLSAMPMEQTELLEQIELHLENLADMNPVEVKKLIRSGAVPVFFTTEKKKLMKIVMAADVYRKKRRFSRKQQVPVEFNEFCTQVRAYMKYHSSIV